MSATNENHKELNACMHRCVSNNMQDFEFRSSNIKKGSRSFFISWRSIVP